MSISKAASAPPAIKALGLAVALFASLPALAQPLVDIGLFPSSTDGVLEVRLRANGNFNQLLSNMVFTISWPASSGVTLDDAHLISLCSAIPVVPNGDGMQQSAGVRYQTYFMLGFTSLGSTCPLVSGQELTVMRIPLIGLTSCTNLNIADDAYTGSHNKDLYISLNGLDRTGSIYSSPVSECVCTALSLDITTDAQPAQTGWEIRDVSSGLVAISGTMPGNRANRTVHIPACLAQGCYRLTVTDAGGNGITGGGYLLHQGANRIIDASGAFGSSSAIADDGSFCIPLGPTFLKPPFCDLTGIAVNDILSVKKLAPANGYGFEIFDPHGSFDTTVFRNGPNLKFTANLWNKVPHFLDLNVRVNARVGGVFGAFGKVCKAQFGGGAGMALGIDELSDQSDAGLSVFPNPLVDET
ncbi:MAG: hypothetical protein ABI373_07925, partial [Flavobacteriales bacterium]